MKELHIDGRKYVLHDENDLACATLFEVPCSGNIFDAIRQLEQCGVQCRYNSAEGRRILCSCFFAVEIIDLPGAPGSDCGSSPQ